LSAVLLETPLEVTAAVATVVAVAQVVGVMALLEVALVLAVVPLLLVAMLPAVVTMLHHSVFYGTHRKKKTMSTRLLAMEIRYDTVHG
jgi:fatty acid desaturase